MKKYLSPLLFFLLIFICSPSIGFANSDTDLKVDDSYIHTAIKDTIANHINQLILNKATTEDEQDHIFNIYEEIEEELSDLDYSISEIIINSETNSLTNMSTITLNLTYTDEPHKKVNTLISSSDDTDVVINNSEELYKTIKEGLEEAKETINTRYTESYCYQDNVVINMIKDVLLDYPELNYVTRYSCSNSAIHIYYDFPVTEIREMINKVDDKAKKIIEDNINASMSDHDKLEILHDYLVINTKYDTDEDRSLEAYSAYGALIKGKAVCSGYTAALSKLLHLLDIDCKKISGTAVNSEGQSGIHCWNLVKINDKWLHIDATWDDPIPDNPHQILYKYFLVDDEIIEKDHYWK